MGVISLSLMQALTPTETETKTSTETNLNLKPKPSTINPDLDLLFPFFFFPPFCEVHEWPTLDPVSFVRLREASSSGPSTWGR
jgi:hypothetical protein